MLLLSLFVWQHLFLLNEGFGTGLFGILDMMIIFEKGDQVCQANRF
jgi:hypothetical protein